jgi:hypothetical protein
MEIRNKPYMQHVLPVLQIYDQAGSSIKTAQQFTFLDYLAQNIDEAEQKNLAAFKKIKPKLTQCY